MPLIAATRPTWLGTRSARPTAPPPWHTALTPTAQHLLAVPGSLRTWGGSLEAVRGQTLLPPLLWKARTGSARSLVCVLPLGESFLTAGHSPPSPLGQSLNSCALIGVPSPISPPPPLPKPPPWAPCDSLSDTVLMSVSRLSL